MNTSDMYGAIDDDAPGAAGALGARLAHARAGLGLSIQEAAARAGLDPAVAAGLEEDAFDRLGAPIFVRGYLGRYAGSLGLPKDEVLEQFRRLGAGEPPPLRPACSIKPQASMSHRGVQWFSYVFVAAIVGFLGWFGLEQVSTGARSTGLAGVAPELLSPEPGAESARAEATRPEAGPAGEATAFTASPIPPAPGGGEPAPAAESPAIVRPLPVAVSQPAPAANTAAPPQIEVRRREPARDGDAAEVTEVSTVEVGGESIVGAARLELRFAGDCWVDIKDAKGNRLAYGLMKGNSVETVSGPAPFAVVLGKADSVDIRFNGRPVAKETYAPAHGGTVARFHLPLPKKLDL